MTRCPHFWRAFEVQKGLMGESLKLVPGCGSQPLNKFKFLTLTAILHASVLYHQGWIDSSGQHSQRLAQVLG